MASVPPDPDDGDATTSTISAWLARSRVYSAAERTIANARVVAGARRLLARGATGAVESRVADLLRGSVLARAVNRGLGRARAVVAASASADVAGGTREAVLDSWLYRWLTKEPEPEVIVIDLRETLSVGPVIAVLDWLVGLFARVAHTSGLVWASERTVAGVRAAPVRVGSIVLASALVTVTVVSLALGRLSGTLAIALVVGGLVSLFGLRETRSLDELRESRVGELLVALLAPPEPPEESESERQE